MPLFLRTAVQGGGLFVSGSLLALNDTTFYGNQAGQEGPAVMSVGSLEDTDGATFTFISNSFYCAQNYYGYDISVADEKVGVGVKGTHSSVMVAPAWYCDCLDVESARA